MDKKQIGNVLVPALAVAALVVVAGFVIMAGDKPGGGKKSDGKTDPKPAGSAEGMTLTLPNIEAPEWKPLADGLKIWDVVEGTGEALRDGGRGQFHYTGWTTDGNIFNSSVKRGEPIEFPLTGVIKGWTLGLPGLKVGGVRRLYIPSPLGYGPQGSGASIPPNATLVFEVKLLAIK